MKIFNLFIFSGIDDSYGRGLLQGISLYKRTHGNWHVRLCPYDSGFEKFNFSEYENACVIARPEVFRSGLFNPLEIPTIIISPRHRWNLTPENYYTCAIRADTESIVTTAFRYLKRRENYHYAYIGYADAPWACTRCETFCNLIQKETGKNAVSFMYNNLHKRRRLESQTISWLKNLPKPCGLLACDDLCGRQILSLCHSAGIAVPEEIALIGVDNDAILCELSSPSLSSVKLDTFRAGYESIRYLEGIMERAPSERIVEKPDIIMVTATGIQPRESTEKYIYRDYKVNKALEFIRQNGTQPIRLEEIAEHVGCSSRTLQNLFRKITGKPISDVIVENRLGNLKTYLAETDLQIKQIAREMKFSSPSHLIHFFKNETGQTPEEFRKQRPMPEYEI